MESQSLVLRDSIINELLAIKSVEQGVTHLNKLNAIEVWVKAEKKDAELQNLVAEQKIRTQRILGEMIRIGQAKGEIKTSATAKSGVCRSLDNLGLNKKQSSTFQQIASIPEETFEEFITEKKEKVNNAVAELTTTGAVKLAKRLRKSNEDVHAAARIHKRNEVERELKSLANDINKKYSKDQRELLISFINH
jgi:hypothetical protein